MHISEGSFFSWHDACLVPFDKHLMQPVSLYQLGMRNFKKGSCSKIEDKLQMLKMEN